MAQISRLKKDQNDEKEIMEELMSQTPTDEDLTIVNIEKHLNDFSVDDLLVPMSQVSLKDVEIRELKEENELDTFMSREVPVPKGDKVQSLTQEELD